MEPGLSNVSLLDQVPPYINYRINGIMWRYISLGPRLRPATVEDYNRWLVKYFNAGGTISRYYDGPFPEEGFFIANSNITIDDTMRPRLEDAVGGPDTLIPLNVIVPYGIRIDIKCSSYHIFWIRNGTHEWGGENHKWVPGYNDTIGRTPERYG